MNKLYYGDNLDVLRRHIKDETVDLIYLDPPFNSNATYNVLYREQDGSRAAAQIKAFEDTWHWDKSAAETYQEIVEAGGKVSQTMQAFRLFLGDNDMLAYLTMMAPRLVELRRVLKPTGSIYLHCDPTASHYLKLLMDATFGPKQFLNEIAWCYNVGGKSKRHWARKHDIILFYAKGSDWFFDGARVGIKRDTGNKSFGGKMGIDEQGRRYQDKLVKASGKYYRYYLDEPKIPEDWWVGINSIQSQAAERLGYPTQKPEALLERIINASSNPNDLVLDPFCGCGTTIVAAQNTGRQWIGIDITHLAVTLMKHRLMDAFGKEAVYQVIGEPVSLPDAQALADSDKYQFQWWALGLVGARPADPKKGSDKGIDGRLYFHDEADGSKTKQVIFSVKGGHTDVRDIRDLRGVLDREHAELGVLITMQQPSQPMKTEAAGAEFYHSPGWRQDYTKIQILTIEQLLSGKGIEMPPLGNVTFKKAPPAVRGRGESEDLGI